jgi:Bacterial toxin YdaS
MALDLKHQVDRGSEKLSSCYLQGTLKSKTAARTQMNSIKTGVIKAIRAGGGQSALARALKINRQAIHRWTRIPADRILEIERVTGVPREELRPDLYRSP